MPAAFAVTAFALSAPAAAQSLSLTYNLDPITASQLPKASPIVNRCTGLTWAATLATACIAELTAVRVITAVAAKRAEAAPPEAVDDGGKPAGASGTYVDGTPRRYELPTLGTPSESRVIRAAGGRDDYIGNARAVDLNFRFGPKYRMRSGDEGWEVYKFNDAATENKLQQSNGGGVRQVGVELLVPFR
ncbi:MAG TPA: hypothetical protein VHP37_22305 [Burkholderiales bacterium]|nr:hypothetical protein [Burkholderiales bacterium]